MTTPPVNKHDESDVFVEVKTPATLSDEFNLVDPVTVVFFATVTPPEIVTEVSDVELTVKVSVVSPPTFTLFAVKLEPDKTPVTVRSSETLTGPDIMTFPPTKMSSDTMTDSSVTGTSKLTPPLDTTIDCVVPEFIEKEPSSSTVNDPDPEPSNWRCAPEMPP
jgi:hypothetical protein